MNSRNQAIDSSYYNPTPEQRAQLKAHAASMRGRIRAMRSLRDTTSGFNRSLVSDVERSTFDTALELGWSPEAAAEFAEIAKTLRQ